MPPYGDSGGFVLSLVTDSFAVRALLGSLAAAVLAALAVTVGAVRTRRARRLVLLAPVLTAAAAGVASIGEVYLPQLWVVTSPSAGGASGGLLDLFGEQRGLVTDRGMDVLVIAYSVVALALVVRRLLGFLAVRRLVRRAAPVRSDHALAREARRLAASLRVPEPRLLLLDRCPGGAFATGLRTPLIAIDPALLDALDAEELEGLLAHELAHLARRDALLGTIVGFFRDLSFFLPPLHAAARWLRREQEEGADELASLHTGRPAALASSILKVWDCSQDHRALSGACSAVAVRALPSGVLLPKRSGAGAVHVLTARVERLIARLPTPSRLRQRTELLLAAAVLVAGTTAALSVPSWLTADPDSEALSFLFLSAAPTSPVESPAFATFRELTPAAAPEIPAATLVAVPDRVTASSRSGCPCVESRAQLRERRAAVGVTQPTRLGWGSDEHPAWAMVTPYEDALIRTAHPVFTLTDSGPQVGLFLVSRPNS